MKIIRIALVFVCLLAVVGYVGYRFLAQPDVIVWPAVNTVGCDDMKNISANNEKYRGGLCTPHFYPLSQATATVWAEVGYKYPLAKLTKVTKDDTVFSRSPKEWKPYLEFLYSDLQNFWVGLLGASGVEFSPPKLLILNEQELKTYPEMQTWGDGKIDRIFYDRVDNVIVIPDPSVWGDHLQPCASASVDYISALVAFAYATSIESQVGLLNLLAFDEVQSLGYYLTGVYFNSRFSKIDVTRIPEFGKRAYFVEGFRRGDPSYPAAAAYLFE